MTGWQTLGASIFALMILGLFVLVGVLEGYKVALFGFGLTVGTVVLIVLATALIAGWEPGDGWPF